MRAEEAIPSIIADLYAGTLDSEAWERAIIGLTDLIGASGAHLFAVNRLNARVLRDEGHRLDPASTTAYREYWSTRDILIEPFMRIPVGEPATDYQMSPLWENCELFNELAIPYDVPYVLGTILHLSEDKFVALSIKASVRHGPFHKHEAQRLKVIIPHLRRALEIKDRLVFSQVRADTLAKSLDNLSFGIIVLDVGGHILEASALAQELLRSGNGIHRNPDDTLWLSEPAGTQLEQWIFNATPPIHNHDGLLHVPRPLARPLSVMVTKLPEMQTSWMSGGPPCWMLMLFDPDRRLSVSTELIAHDLGISAREAEIAALLVSGYDLKHIASRLGISIHTARTHLKAIFSRMGSRSQAELIQRISNGPAGHCRSSGDEKC